MDVGQVSESIALTNDLVTQAVTAQTKMLDDLTQVNIQAKTQAAQAQEEGKGLFLDTIA
jgi:hypothetical protein